MFWYCYVIGYFLENGWQHVINTLSSVYSAKQAKKNILLCLQLQTAIIVLQKNNTFTMVGRMS